MNLEELQTNWDQLGRDDAMWAVLTDPQKKGGKWTPADFFETGEKEIAELFASLENKGIKVTFGTALDFGCGVGRLTQAFARRFSEAHGVDIAQSMVDQARKFNKHPETCRYHVNPNNDLRLFSDEKFDFIYTFIVLQHIPGKFVLDYIREFVRILRPRGIAHFQFIEPPLIRRMIPGAMLDQYRRLRQGRAAFVWEFGVSGAAVDSVLAKSGAQILHKEKCRAEKEGWNSYTYIVTRA